MGQSELIPYFTSKEGQCYIFNLFGKTRTSWIFSLSPLSEEDWCPDMDC